jgi:predicted metal-dependent peptidase
VDFVSCDAAIADGATGKIKTAKEAVEKLRGGGGTDFRPVFEYADNLRDPPSVVVFFTDGYGPAPTTAPTGYGTVWMITEGGVPPCKWGTHISLTDGQTTKPAIETADEDEDT